MKFGNFPDEPIPPLVFNPPKKQKYKLQLDMTQILDSTGRKVTKMLPDGNCLFRSLSFCLYQTQDRHMEIRSTLVEFIFKNGDHYKPLLFEGTLTDHLEMMRKPGAWGTQVELQAAADYYKMSIYLLTKREQQDRYQWYLYRPRNSAVPADGLPHIELAHPGSVHFDCIVDASTLQNPKSIPQLDGGTDNFEGIL